MIPATDIERAHTVRIEDETARRGLRLVGRNERNGPCPVCGGTDRFAINIRKQVWNCRGCQRGGDVIALVEHVDGCSFAHAVAKLTGERPRPAIRKPVARPNGDNSERANRLWSQRQPITKDTPVAKYLRKRGITGTLPPTLGYLPAHRQYPPAMIAAFGLVRERAPGLLVTPTWVEGVHLTWLTADGDKTFNADGKSKIMLGACKGVPIVIAAPNDLLGMAITEGIEDALSICAATRLGTWAAGAAGFMPALADMVPDWIECLTICQHADDAGRRNATELADLLQLRGIEVFFEGNCP
jgi:phage/plasmid primase-like uncharacterized protein